MTLAVRAQGALATGALASGWLTGLLLTMLMAGTATAAGQARKLIKVRVTEVAGRRAYVAPGSQAGLRRGDRVLIGRRRFKVIAASAESALIATRGRRLKVGQRGRARVRTESDDTVERLPPPSELASFRGQWPDATLPASEQAPKHVPLTRHAARRGRVRASLTAGGVARLPLEDGPFPLARGMLRGRVRAQPVMGLPLLFEADAALQIWIADDLAQRAGRDSRPLGRLYALNGRYGERGGFNATLGRLRYAASGVGTLDGVRVEAPVLDTLTVAAFGGLVPSPLDGVPATETSRFGAEVVYEAADADLRPRISATLHGSRYRGQLDERRLLLQADVYPADGYGGAYALLSRFDEDNPWGAPMTEVTAAGAHAGVRLDSYHVGARLDMQRPERSLWLADFLPPGWLCIARAAPASDQTETCFGDEARYLGQLDTGLTFETVAVDVGLTASRTARRNADQYGGFAHLRINPLGHGFRMDVTGSASEGAVIRTVALTLAPGLRIGERLDINLRYRPAITNYRADVDTFFEQTFGAGLLYTPTAAFDVGLDIDTIHGRDVKLLLIQLLTNWRI